MQSSSRVFAFAFAVAAHHGVEVTDDEKRTVACWLDFGVPFGGSYPEATLWTDSDRRAYEYHQCKRLAFAAREIEEAKQAVGAWGADDPAGFTGERASCP